MVVEGTCCLILDSGGTSGWLCTQLLKEVIRAGAGRAPNIGRFADGDCGAGQVEENGSDHDQSDVTHVYFCH